MIEVRKCCNCKEIKPLTPENWAWKDKTHTEFRSRCRKCTNWDSKISHMMHRGDKKGVVKMNDEEFNELQDFLFKETGCEWDKRKKCDSLYIVQYNKLLKVLKTALKYVEETDNLDKEHLKNILKNR